MSLCAQEYFCGANVVRNTMHYLDDTDMLIEQVKNNALSNPALTPQQRAVAITQAPKTVADYKKQQERQRYVYGMPEGENIGVTYADGANNRTIGFMPKLGRLVMTNGDTGEMFIAFPRIKAAIRWLNDANVKAVDFRKILLHTPAVDESEVEIRNGFRCVPNSALVDYDKVGGEMIDTVTYEGKLCVKVPAPGYVFAEYNKLLCEQQMSTESYESEHQVLRLESFAVDPQSFVLLDGYKMYTNVDKLIDAVIKAEKKGQLAIPFDENAPLPESMWLIVLKGLAQ